MSNSTEEEWLRDRAREAKLSAHFFDGDQRQICINVAENLVRSADKIVSLEHMINDLGEAISQLEAERDALKASNNEFAARLKTVTRQRDEWRQIGTKGKS